MRKALDERGSSPVEFLLVGTLLTLLTLAVVQLALVVYVRNVVHDAAVEGAYVAALADTSLEEGVERSGEVITRSIGASYATDVAVREEGAAGQPTVAVRIRTTFPIVGLIGIPSAIDVEGRAPVESFDDE